MILLYWDIGRAILAKQQVQGWGARVIDRLSYDLKTAFPAMSGFSPCNLKYMRLFASAWPDRMVVQRTVAQLPWRSNLALLEKLDVPEQRLWYAEKAIQQGLSKDMLVVQIESRWHERQGVPRTTSPWPCRRPIQTWQHKSSKTPTCLTFWARPLCAERLNWNRNWWITSSPAHPA